MRTVSDILKNKPSVFNIIDPDAKIIDALHMMNSVNLSYLVVKKNDVFQGVFSERDYSRNVILRGLHSDSSLVKDAMSVSFPSVGMDETVESCMKLLNSHKLRYLLVFDNKHFKGVITINDVLREVIANKELVFDDNLVLAFKESADLKDKIF